MVKVKNLGATSTMEKNVKPETQGTLCCDFPEDLLMNIFASLPITSLMRFRTVSKRWNAIVMDPQFHGIRRSICREFIEGVLRSPRFREVGKVSCSVKGFLFIVRGRHEIYVLRPSDVSLRRLPTLDCTLDIRRLEVGVCDVVMDETTKNYVVFTSSYVNRSLPSLSDKETGGGPTKQVTRKNLHHYDSETGVWSFCGSGGLNLNSDKGVLGVTIHRDRYTALVTYLNIVDDLIDEENPDIYEVLCRGESRWETLPGGFLRGVPELGISKDIALFDHGGMLYVAVSSFGGCWLRKYVDDTSEWDLIRDFRRMVRQNENNPLYFDRQYSGFPYVEVLGDCLHLGIRIPGTSGHERRGQRMTYNLATGEFESMSRADSQVMVVGPFGRQILFQPE